MNKQFTQAEYSKYVDKKSPNSPLAKNMVWAFVVGGIINRKTHYFENLVKVKNDKLEITEELKDRINNGCYVGFLEGGNFENEVQIKEELKPLTVSKFFSNLEEEVRKYYGV